MKAEVTEITTAMIEDLITAVATLIAHTMEVLRHQSVRRPVILPTMVCQSLISPTQITW